jgi:hypothetical protein
MLADSFEELLAGDMAGAFARFLPEFDGVIQRVFEEVIRFVMKAGIVAHDAVESFGKIQFLHRLIGDPERRKRTRADGLSR